jgi:hypothetical protein
MRHASNTDGMPPCLWVKTNHGKRGLKYPHHAHLHPGPTGRGFFMDFSAPAGGVFCFSFSSDPEASQRRQIKISWVRQKATVATLRKHP